MQRVLFNTVHDQKRTNIPFKYYLFAKICSQYLNAILRIYFVALGTSHSIHPNQYLHFSNCFSKPLTFPPFTTFHIINPTQTSQTHATHQSSAPGRRGQAAAGFSLPSPNSSTKFCFWDAARISSRCKQSRPDGGTASTAGWQSSLLNFPGRHWLQRELCRAGSSRASAGSCLLPCSTAKPTLLTHRWASIKLQETFRDTNLCVCNIVIIV